MLTKAQIEWAARVLSVGDKAIFILSPLREEVESCRAHARKLEEEEEYTHKAALRMAKAWWLECYLKNTLDCKQPWPAPSPYGEVTTHNPYK